MVDSQGPGRERMSLPAWPRMRQMMYGVSMLCALGFTYCTPAVKMWRNLDALLCYPSFRETVKPVRLLRNALGRINGRLHQQRQLAEQLPRS